MPHFQEEHICIQKAIKGDQRSYKLLYDDNVRQLFRFLRQYSEDKHLVEDWVQRTFIKAYHNLESFKGESRFSTWLISIALNEMRTDVRRKHILVFTEHDLPDRIIESEEERFAWNDSMKILLQELDDQKRSIFLLFEVEGYTHAEIAQIMQIGENASRTLLCRAKQQLRTKWETMEKAI